MVKKKKKRVFKIRNIIIILVVFFVVSGIIYYFLSMPVKNIYVIGNDIVSDEEILSLAGLDDYPSFILSNRGHIKRSVLNNKYVNSVNVDKKIGNIIEVEIVENKVLASDGSGNVILSNGSVLENDYNIFDVPRLINNIGDFDIGEFSLKFSRVDSNILRQISEIEYSPLDVDGDRFLLYMNDGNFVYVTLTKIEKLNKYNDIKDELLDRKGIIYLDSGDYVEVKG